MKRQFTENQEQAITLRHKNILVSAAAGSGKTAVLVERIIRLISEGEHPVDIDRLLVVTFTNAAAAEMRERIIAAISEKLALQPENEHLQRQSALIHNAQITTIHSFCLFVIRNHFQEIGLDPAFRVVDEGEAGLLMQEVLEEVLEEAFTELERARGEAKQESAGGAESVEERGEDSDRMEHPFRSLVEAYGAGKRDTVLEECILSLYRFAMSCPWPFEWLREHGEDYEIHSLRELKNSSFMQYIMEYMGNLLPELARQLEQCIRICERPDGPYMYGENLERSCTALKRAAQAGTFRELREALEGVSFARLSSKKDDSVDPALRERVKQIRNGVKKQLEQLQEQFFLLSEEAVLLQCQRVSPVVRELAALTIRFGERFAEKKREKNMIDFSDMEHLALEILCRRRETEAGVLTEPTAAALELRDYFQEIMIDEYQDSNLVQECILSCISREAAGCYNRFMVGDVKQSIYKFRLARPELFMEKFDTYSEETGDLRRVDLYQNFRSRREVLSSVNLIFGRLLAKDLGGIDYDEKARLHYGAVYYDEAGKALKAAEEVRASDREAAGRERSEKENAEGRAVCGEVSEEKDTVAGIAGGKTSSVEGGGINELDRTEFLLIEKSEEEKTALEQEAEVIALRIRRLLREMKVLGEDGRSLRPVRYGDIVILLRSDNGSFEVFEEVLGRWGIPCLAGSQTGYFQASEVQVMLQLLRVLDNPLQDIPLFGVLKSCFASFTDVEAAQITAAFPGKRKLYRKLELYAAGTDELAEKCRAFLDWYQKLRRCAIWLSVRELLSKIMAESHYLEYVTAMPDGERRRANAQMLLQKAAAFEKTSFKGIYHFIRYIDQIEKYNIDFGEAGVREEQTDAVRIMTIHKSKGLEFPVCFVAGTGKKMNRRDASASVLTDMDMGLAVDEVDPILRTKRRTLRKAALSKKILLDAQAEELRVLYVALTRAKEKLMITGVTDNVEKLLREKSSVGEDGALLSYSVRSSAGSFLELITACVMGTESGEALRQEFEVKGEAAAVIPEGGMICRIVKNTDIRGDMLAENSKTINDVESFKMNLQNCKIDENVTEFLQNRFGYRYPYKNLQKLYAKTTVSELKMAAIHDLAGMESAEMAGEGEEAGKLLFEEETPTPYLPLFLRKEEEEKISGALRGSAMHKVMELMDFGKIRGNADEQGEDGKIKRRTAEEPGEGRETESRAGSGSYDMRQLNADLERWSSTGLLSEEYRKAVNKNKIKFFMNSSMAKRMHLAAKEGKLWKEQPFMLGISADRLSEEFPDTEMVIVQGIIDVFFEEDEEIVLLDYKTDVIDSAEALADRYRVQLDYYGEALERLTGKKVKERVLYSFYLGEEVRA